jgi:hypothetical protein
LNEAQLLFDDGGVELNQALAGGDELTLVDENFLDPSADERAGRDNRAALRLESAEGVDGLLGCRRVVETCGRCQGGVGRPAPNMVAVGRAVPGLKGPGGQSAESHSQEQESHPARQGMPRNEW